MGASFGLALTLVIFAGADLFTGNNMFFTISTLAGVTSIKDTLKVWLWCYIGNFLGAVALCLVVIGAGIFADITAEHTLMKLATKKMNLSFSELFFRGILCNWIVCLAIWMGIRTKNEVAKILVIYACLFTFIVSGYEHSIANMTVLTLSILLPHPENISIAGMVHNLIPVTFGNILGGGIFVGMVYSFINNEKSKKKMIKGQRIKAS
jgi:nitrite transporter NirC